MDTTRLANFMDRAAGFGEQPVLKKPYGMPFESFVRANELLASDPDVAAVFSGVEAADEIGQCSTALWGRALMTHPDAIRQAVDAGWSKMIVTHAVAVQGIDFFDFFGLPPEAALIFDLYKSQNRTTVLRMVGEIARQNQSGSDILVSYWSDVVDVQFIPRMVASGMNRRDYNDFARAGLTDIEVILAVRGGEVPLEYAIASA